MYEISVDVVIMICVIFNWPSAVSSIAVDEDAPYFTSKQAASTAGDQLRGGLCHGAAIRIPSDALLFVSLVGLWLVGILFEI